MAPRGAYLASPCRFWSLFGTPLTHQNGTLGCPAALKSTGTAPWAPRWGSRGHPWRTLCPKGGPGKDFCRFCDPLGSLRVPSGRQGGGPEGTLGAPCAPKRGPGSTFVDFVTPLGHLGSPFDTHGGGGKARFFEIGVGGTGRQAFTINK